MWSPDCGIKASRSYVGLNELSASIAKVLGLKALPLAKYGHALGNITLVFELCEGRKITIFQRNKCTAFQL